MQDFKNLGNDVDYSYRFVTDRKFDSVDDLHNWADEIALTIGFQFTRASCKQKEGRYRISLYLRCHHYGNIRGDLHNLDNVVRPGLKSTACGCKFMIIGSSRKPGKKTLNGYSPGEKGRHNHPFFMYRDG